VIGDWFGFRFHRGSQDGRQKISGAKKEEERSDLKQEVAKFRLFHNGGLESCSILFGGVSLIRLIPKVSTKLTYAATFCSKRFVVGALVPPGSNLDLGGFA
jgi:hypothetical protein